MDRRPDVIDAEFEVVEPPKGQPQRTRLPQTEWADWNLWGRLTYLVILGGLMFPIWLAANWIADLLFGP